MKISEEIKALKLPDTLTFADGRPVTAENWEERRREIIRIFEDNEYGHSPKGPFTVSGKVVSDRDNDYANKVLTEHCLVTSHDETEGVDFSWPVVLHTPKKVLADGKCPLIVFINFRDQTPDSYMPVEEITDSGVAVAMIYYNDISKDEHDDWSTGVAALYDRAKYDWSKIGMWAWSMQRTLDYCLSLGRYDESRIGSLGHSRLGKTSLWNGANDTRFKYVFVNDSGCSGDAVTRHKTGETVEIISRVFPHWFNGVYRSYSDREDEMPFDQHMLVAAVAPRYVYGGTAVEDTWADPYSQYMSYYLANDVYAMLGMKTVDFPDRRPEINEVFAGPSCGYHMRAGAHFLSRYDWQRYIAVLTR